MNEKETVPFEKNPEAYVEPGSRAELDHNFDYGQRQEVWDMLSRIEPEWGSMDNKDKNRTLYLELRNALLEARSARSKAIAGSTDNPQTMFEFMRIFLPGYIQRAEAAAKEKGQNKPEAEEFPDFEKWQDKNREMLESLRAGAKERQMLWELAKAKATIGKK